MNRFVRATLLVTPLLVLSGCQTAPSSDLARGPDAYSLFPPRSEAAVPEYRIGALDVLAISVFGEPDLTFKEIPVDAAGNLRFPLIGAITVAGSTPSELTDLITARLNERYLRNAQVSVIVASSVGQSITVEGNVNEPGVYPIPGGSSSLLEAIARAQSPTRTARLSEIVVFRTENGQRLGARFNLSDIRAGRVPDPTLRGGDIVVVGFSAVKGAFRDFLTTAPFFNLFSKF